MVSAKQAEDVERIVFLGDSLTQQGATPDGYVTLVRQAAQENAPEKTIEVVNAGISGHKVPDLLKRLDKDVIQKAPTQVVVYIGINDVWHSLKGRGTPKETYESGLKELISQIRLAGAKVLICTPSVIGEKTDGTNELDGMLDEYAQISRDVAQETGVELLDLHRAFKTRLKKDNPANRAKGILTRDGVHLNTDGNRFVAELMLGALKLTRHQADGPACLRHIVLFQFADAVTPAAIDTVTDAFSDLQNQIESIREFEAGTNISKENLSRGFTHGFVLTFADQSGLDRYLSHPAHQAFVKLIQGKVKEVLVFDFADGSP